MLSARSKTIAIVSILATILLSGSTELWARTFDNPTNGGTTISNRAEATYRNDAGENFTTVSETVTVTVQTVVSLAVTPDETSPSDTVSPHAQVTRPFRVCNTGNYSDSFTLTRADITAPATINAFYFDNDGSGTVSDGDTQVRLNDTVSPQLTLGGCLGVLAVIDTKDAAPQSTITIRITARSNAANAANGRAEDTGTIINAVGQGAFLTNPANLNLVPSKLVNGLAQVVISSGGQFTYTIAFKNSGESPAQNVVVDDQLPAAIDYVSGSLQLNDRSLPDEGSESSVRDNHIRVFIARINPGETFRISFAARHARSIADGSGLVNTASFTADNMLPVRSSPATVVIDPFGFVFAGRAGRSAPIAGARVEVLQEQGGENLLRLPPDTGFTPNERNENPFSSDGQGRFSFTFSADEMGGANATANYFLRVTAQGYVSRLMQLGLRPTQPGLFTLTIHALDNQPLAIAGGFDLVREDVRIDDLATLALNVPMFETGGLQIVKSADRARAEIGDTITYRIEVHNPTAASVNDVTVEDHLPPSFNYAEGTALIGFGSGSDQTIEPEVQGNVLRFHLGEIPHGATAHVLYRVRVGANANEGEQENLAVASGAFDSGERVTTAPARAVVLVSSGVFSTRQVLIGRVFVDTNGDGHFDHSDRPMPGVRLYLSNGQSVITDSAGLYSFPSLGDGPQVISLDPVTLPTGYTLSDGGRESGKSWTRLLRTPIGGGALLLQNFALLASVRPVSAGGSTSPSLPPKSVSNSSDELKFVGQPGTYEVAAKDNVAAVPPGAVHVISPAPNSVAMSPGLQIEARVALDWSVKAEVNGEQVSDKNIGVRSLDHKNQVSLTASLVARRS